MKRDVGGGQPPTWTPRAPVASGRLAGEHLRHNWFRVWTVFILPQPGQLFLGGFNRSRNKAKLARSQVNTGRRVIAATALIL